MNVDERAKLILLTTKSTYKEYQKHSKQCAIEDLENLNSIFNSSDIQGLINKYIVPFIEKEDETFNYIYEKGVDDKKLNTKQLLEPNIYNNIACLKWVERKRKELEDVRSNPLLVLECHLIP